MPEYAPAILLIDDDVELCALIKEAMSEHGFEVDVAHDGRGALTAIGHRSYELAILDVMLPELDGFGVLRQLRSRTDLPVIMLTSRTSSADRIAGLEFGADDYIAKPFEPRELAARIRAILRRAYKQTSAQSQIIRLPPVSIDATQRRVWRDNDEVAVTSIEFDILELLMRSAGRIVSRADITEKLYGRQPSGFDSAIEVHICHLRRKLESETRLIRTIRGVGYQFCVPHTP